MTPCDDLTCGCCWPDLQCWCTGRCDLTPGHGDVFTCPDCGARYRAVGVEHLPDEVRRRRDRTISIARDAMARNGRVLPEQPSTVWQRLSPATRVKGASGDG